MTFKPTHSFIDTKPNTPEWREAVKRVRAAMLHLNLGELFLLENAWPHSKEAFIEAYGSLTSGQQKCYDDAVEVQKRMHELIIEEIQRREKNN